MSKHVPYSEDARNRDIMWTLIIIEVIIVLIS